MRKGSVLLFDDLDCPVAFVLQGASELATGIAAISKNMAQSGKIMTASKSGGTLNIGAMHNDEQHRAERIGDNMPPLTLTYLRHIAKRYNFDYILVMIYSLDFRQKVLSVRERDNPTFQQVADRFSVGIASVAR